jgi:protein-S-isoprenylcysteine O-methyltransferase Ste14
MYVGFTLWYLAATSWINTFWPLLLLPLVLLVMQLLELGPAGFPVADLERGADV